MSIFCITRKSFPDRPMPPEELFDFAEFLRAGYLLHARTTAGQGLFWCEAVIYAFPRYQRPELRAAIEQAAGPGLHFDESNPDELRVSTSPQRATESPDIGLWLHLLELPECRNTCLRLRITFEGPVSINPKRGSRGQLHGRNTFVLCGAPDAGRLLLKALWPLQGNSEIMQEVHRAARWKDEQTLLNAFDTYLRHAGADPDEAARTAWLRLKNSVDFVTIASDSHTMHLLRLWAELPDDRGPLAFLRRLGISLALLIASLVLLYFCWSLPVVRLPGLIGVAYALPTTLHILWKKFAQVRRYRTAMRKGLGALHNKPVGYQFADLSNDLDPTLLKCSAEAEELGAHHVCDVSISTARMQLDANRFYILDDSQITIGLLRKAVELHFFPPRPVLVITTRFTDGSRHGTVNRPLYRKPRPNFTSRCLLNDGSLAELLELHRRVVDPLKKSGRSVQPVPATPDAVLKQLREDAEESRAAWKERPYSWSDALHESFKVCRREYLPGRKQ